MLKAKDSFSGFSVDELERTRDFYADTLGLKVDVDDMGLTLHMPGGHEVFLYAKEDHRPATFTVLNFVVDDIDAAMDDLAAKGVRFEKYGDSRLPQDEKGVLRGRSAGQGPDIAWFTDPAGNVLSVLQEA